MTCSLRIREQNLESGKHKRAKEKVRDTEEKGGRERKSESESQRGRDGRVGRE